jgi:hypothetical protein
MSLQSEKGRQEGSYYLAMERKKAGVQPQPLPKKRQPLEKETILEQREEDEQDLEEEQAQPERIKFNEELRNLLFD